MNSAQVAAELNLSPQDFSKIEESIASILGISPDAAGEYHYGPEHLVSLKEVFVDQKSVHNTEEISPTLDNGLPSQLAIPKKDAMPPGQGFEFPAMDESFAQQVELKSKGPVPVPQRAWDDYQAEVDGLSVPEGGEAGAEDVQAPPVHQARVHNADDSRVQMPGFERLRRDDSGEVRMADYENAWSPGQTRQVNQQFQVPINRQNVAQVPGSMLTQAPVQNPSPLAGMDEHHMNMEMRLRELETSDLFHLREENLLLKKENLALKKEIATLQNIVRNQDHDRMHLVQRLNEKYSIKRLLQWKMNGEESYSGKTEVGSNLYLP